jgi:thiol-disulfide isomerase/thioredoxin
MKLANALIISGLGILLCTTNLYAVNFPPCLDKNQTHLQAKNDVPTGMPGSVAAAFSTTDINSKPLKLSDFKGKYVLLDFWASWCVPCRKSNPHIIELYHKYKGKGFDVIGVADDDNRLLQWRNAVKQDSTGIWHQVLRGAGKISAQQSGKSNSKDLHLLYNIQSLPTKILIDPTGKIIGRYGDNDTTDDDLDKALTEIFK